MADKELRKMSRMELVEIIYALQQNERTIREENTELRNQLDDKILRIEKAGSIAEAALGLNRIFEDADAAAKQYLATLQEAETGAAQVLADAQQKADEMIAEAEAKASQILADAQQKADEMISEAEQDVQKRKQAFAHSVKSTLEKHPGLAGQLKKEADERKKHQAPQ